MPAPHPFNTTYNLVINEQQREVICAALSCHISEGFDDERDEFGANTAVTLLEMLKIDTVNPLMPAPCVNGLVV